MQSSWVDIEDGKTKFIFDDEGFELHNLPINIIKNKDFNIFLNDIHNEIFDKISELNIL